MAIVFSISPNDPMSDPGDLSRQKTYLLLI